MQLVGAVERRRLDVERNMDLIREMLLRIAADPKLDGSHHFVFNSKALLRGVRTATPIR